MNREAQTNQNEGAENEAAYKAKQLEGLHLDAETVKTLILSAAAGVDKQAYGDVKLRQLNKLHGDFYMFLKTTLGIAAAVGYKGFQPSFDSENTNSEDSVYQLSIQEAFDLMDFFKNYKLPE